MPAGDVKRQTREIIESLRQLSSQSDEAKTALEQFGGVLERFGAGKFVKDWNTLSTAINQTTLALTGLGESGVRLDAVRRNLQSIASQYRYFSGKGTFGVREEQQAIVTGDVRRLAQRQMDITQRRQESIAQGREISAAMAREGRAYDEVGDSLRRAGARYDEWIRARQQAVQAMAARFPRRPSAFQERAGGMAVGGGRILPGAGLQAPVTETEGSLKRITEAFRDFIPGGQVGIENFTKKMESLGITSAKVTAAHEDLSSGVRTLRFRIDRGAGAIATATVNMDQYGNVMRDTTNKFRTFSSAIGRNLLKVLQWGIATGVLYGAMRQLSEIMKQIIQIEVQMADVQVALGKGTGDLNQIFKEAAIIADLTSQSLVGVVESYALAFQAAGGMEDILVRGAKANALLRESMVLAQISGLEQAKAMDTLIGALRQTGRELDDGRELLDKWVAVSRESNVSVATMAETYAIVGAQAKDLGLEFEQLNALAATLAEATPLSATEVGNALRGIMAGFQTSQAEKVLGRFTIETREASGELKNFWSLLEEISELIASGALSPAEITEISNAIGGGYRRGGQVQVILRGMARSQQLVNEQWDAGGQAADALEIKMATLQAAITRLGNAFTQLAQTLGDEGGILDIAKFLVEAFTAFVGVIDDLVSGLGKATPAILAFAAAYAVLNTQQAAGLMGAPATGMLAGLAGRIGGAPLGGYPSIGGRLAGVTAPMGVMAAPTQVSRGGAFGAIRGGLAGRMGGIDPLSAAIAIGAPALTAYKAAGQPPGEERTEGFIKAGGQFVGAVVGGLIGSATIVGAPIGTAIGAAMGGAFADSVTDTDIGARIAERFAEEARQKRVEGELIPPTVEELIPESREIMANIAAFFGNITEAIFPGEQFGHIERPEGAGLTGEDILINILQGTSGLEIIQGLFTQEARDELARLTAAAYEEGLGEGDFGGAFRRLIESSTPEMERAAGPIVGAFLEEARRQFILGDIGLGDFLDISKEITAPRIATDIATLKETLSLAGADISVGELIQAYLDLDDSVQILLLSAQQLAVAEDVLRYGMGEGAFASERLAEAERDRDTAAQDLIRTYETLTKAQQVGAVQRLEVFEVGKLTPQQVQMGIELAQSFTKAYYLEITKGNEEIANLMIEQLQPLLVKHGEGIGAVFGTTIAGTTAQAMGEAFEALDLSTKIKETTFGFRDLREQLGMADLPALIARYERVKATIGKEFPEFEIEEEPTGLILKDGFATLDIQMTLFNLAMQDLIDINEQQLEGVWNIPAGMTAMVAITSLYRQQPGAGGQQVPFDELFNETARAGTTGVGKAATPGRIFTDADISPSLQALKDRVDRLDALVDLGAREAGVGVQDYAALKEEAEVARGDYMSAFYQAVRETNMGVGGPAGTPQVDSEAIVQSFQEAFQIENKIELNANIRLVVDGRTLANVVKQYLFEDLVGEASKSLGGGGGNYVVAPE